jgi:hypothetical protein
MRKAWILIVLVFSMTVSGCSLIQESPDGDDMDGPWGIPIPWKKHSQSGQWTECVNKYEKSCNQICDEMGKDCDQSCRTDGGLPGYGSQAWMNSEGCQGGSQNDGQESCGHIGDLQGSEPRWKCCCE